MDVFPIEFDNIVPVSSDKYGSIPGEDQELELVCVVAIGHCDITRPAGMY